MFTTDLVVTRIIGVANTWKTAQPLVYKKGRLCIKVPKNFIFNFASVPRLFWNIFSPNGGRYDRASCLHDWLYTTHMFKRSKCDKIFYWAMLDDRTPKWKAWLFYKAVRLGGWYAWNKIKNAELKEMRKFIGKDEIRR